MISLKTVLCLLLSLHLSSLSCSACDLYDTDTAVCAQDLEEICGMNAFPDSIQSLYDSRNCLRKNKDLITPDCVNYLELDKPSIIDSCFIEMKTYCMKIVPGGFRIHSCLSGIAEQELSLNCQQALHYDQQLIEQKGSIFPLSSSSSSSSSASPSSSSIDSSSSSADVSSTAETMGFWGTWSSFVEQLSKEIIQSHQSFLTSYFVHHKNPVVTTGTTTTTSASLRGTLYIITETHEEETEEIGTQETESLTLIEGDDNNDGEDDDDDQDDASPAVPITIVTDDDDNLQGDDDDCMKEIKENILAAAGSSHKIIEDENAIPHEMSQEQPSEINDESSLGEKVEKSSSEMKSLRWNHPALVQTTPK